MSRRPQPVTPWLLLDGPQGWERRGRLAAAVHHVDDRIGELERELVDAHHLAAVRTHERDRLRNRRAVRLATELLASRGRPVGRSLRALRAAAEPRSTPPAPPAPPHPPARDLAATTVADADHAEPTVPLPTPRFPHVRVLHLGAVARFSALATHTTLDPDGWREQLQAGTDLVLLEPPADAAWDPFPGGLGALLNEARRAGIPSVRIHLPGSVLPDDAPRADHELHEGTGTDALPVTVDTSSLHPTGWRRQPTDPVVALATGPVAADVLDVLAAVDPPVLLLHPPRTTPRRWDGRHAVIRSPGRLQARLRGAGVLLDLPGLHDDPAERRRSWHAARACGAPVVAVDTDADLPGVLATDRGAGPDGAVDTIHRLLTDLDQRERHSIVGRRHVLGTADREVAFRDLCDRLALPLPPPPRTTVVLATHRPHYLDHAGDAIARQTRPDVEVVLVLHGADDVVTTPDRFPATAAVVRAPGRWTLGDCLNAGLDHATGDLIAKMDDDDHYGPEHLTDLVHAQRYSGADVVGKRIEFVHLAGRDLTVRRSPAATETDRPHVGGPTILATAERLRRTRFLRLPSRVDSTLYERVLADGARVYRTHSRDVVLERHGGSHAWEVTDASFVDEAVTTRPGLDVAFASSDPANGPEAPARLHGDGTWYRSTE